MFDSLLATTLNHPTPPANISARRSTRSDVAACLCRGGQNDLPPNPLPVGMGSDADDVR